MFRFHIKHPIIIIGMHRSGTTMVSKLLDAAGVFQGVLKDHNNEAFQFLSLNQQCMEKSGFDWLNPGEPEKGHWTTRTPDELYAEHFRLTSDHKLKTRVLCNRKWGWKDPRNTFTLNMWLSIFPQARILHIVRNGVDVALSLQQRNHREGEVRDQRLEDLAFNFRLWEQYAEKGMEAEKKAVNYLEVRYEDLLNHDEIKFRELAGFTGIKWGDELRWIKKPQEKKDRNNEALMEIAANSKAYQRWYS